MFPSRSSNDCPDTGDKRRAATAGAAYENCFAFNLDPGVEVDRNAISLLKHCAILMEVHFDERRED